MPHTYIPGLPPARSEPLGRFLPPVPVGVLTAWLAEAVPIDEQARLHPWVLDPYGAAPRPPVEAARAGYRVLVAANNPINRFLLEMAAKPPGAGPLRAALALLASERRGEERLEPHIRNLYATTCDQCNAEVFAEAFIWERTSAAGDPPEARLISRVYHCPACETSGEFPATTSDINRGAAFITGSLHRSRALERVTRRDDPDRKNAEEALDAYPPRAVYALFTLINRLDAMNLTPGQHSALSALLLHAFDQANTLWPHPSGRARPRQLTVPPRYRENNIWLALEAAVDVWASSDNPVALTIWPDLPPATGGICLYEGRLRDLADWLTTVPVQAVAAVLPRPNQAFWTLSALWAGWLWGQDAVAPFKSVLRRRRYDWTWHTTALHAALENLAPHIKVGTPFFGLVAEAEPGFISAALASADLAGFALDGLALRDDSGIAQFTWHTQAVEPSTPAQIQPAEIARKAALSLLEQRGQPASYLCLHTAAAAALAEGRYFHNHTAGPVEAISQFNTIIGDVFTYRQGFLRYGGSDKSLEVGLWWVRPDAPVQIKIEAPLADRVEIAIVNHLLKNPGAATPALDRAICAAFPGLLTPAIELVMVCLESYAVEAPPGSGSWHIQDQDLPRSRRADLNEITGLLKNIGSRLGYIADGARPMTWSINSAGESVSINIIASSVVGEILGNEYNNPPGIIVIPGGRANLLAYKMQKDPRLRQAMESGWKLVRYRLVRALASNPALTPEIFGHLVAAESLTYESPQMRLW